VRAPFADALDRDEFGDHGFVIELIEAVELEAAAEDVLGERAQVEDLCPRQPGRRAQLLGVGVEDRLRRRRRAAPPKCPSRRSQIACAALVESCWPQIVRTSPA
jgi:hypothetical protein